MHTEMKRCGILFNTGCYMLPEKENWLKFVNTHTNQNGGVFQDCVVIVCAHADLSGTNDSKWILKEEQFGNNCDIYSIQPTLEEWTTWVAPRYRPEILKVVRAYIEKNGIENKGIRNEPYGFDFWQKVMDSLYYLAEESDCPLNQIQKMDVELELQGRFGTKNLTINEFIDFIYEQDTSM